MPIHTLFDPDPGKRANAARILFADGCGRISAWLENVESDQGFEALLIHEEIAGGPDGVMHSPRLTVGVAVQPRTFDKIRAANGSPSLADAPSDQDVMEFELEFAGERLRPVRLDILTTKTPDGGGAIDKFLQKFGEGIQQVELDVTNVNRATEILRAKFNFEPIFPATRPGANGTRVNFFLIASAEGKKVLVEFVEQPRGLS